MAEVPSSGALDWPLSREEKKQHVIKLYDRDVKAADHLLKSGETALESLRHELHKLRSESKSCQHRTESFPGGRDEEISGTETSQIAAPAGIAESGDGSSGLVMDCSVFTVASRSNPGTPRPMLPPAKSTVGNEGKEEAAERLRLAISEATEALGALIGAAALEQQEADDCVGDGDALRSRARSEGARGMAAQPALRTSRERRRSRGGEELRVKFDGEDTSTGMGTDIPQKTFEQQHDPGPHGREMSPSVPDAEPEPAPEVPPSPPRPGESTRVLQSPTKVLQSPARNRSLITSSSTERVGVREERKSGRSKHSDRSHRGGISRSSMLGTTVTLVRCSGPSPLEGVRSRGRPVESSSAPATAMDFL